LAEEVTEAAGMEEGVKEEAAGKEEEVAAAPGAAVPGAGGTEEAAGKAAEVKEEEAGKEEEVAAVTGAAATAAAGSMSKDRYVSIGCSQSNARSTDAGDVVR
jgi:hypothetical protein